MNFNINLFLIIGIFVTLSSLVFIFITIRYSDTKVSRVWALFNLAVGIWSSGTILISLSRDYGSALLSWKYAHIGVIFIPIFFYHVVVQFCQLKNKLLLILAYFQGIVFLLLVFLHKDFIQLKFVFNSVFYNISSGIYYDVFFLNWLILIVLGQFELLKTYKLSFDKDKNKILYFFIANCVGFIGGATNFLPMYGVDFYPYGNCGIPIYTVLSTYAILKYRLMSINLALTRTGIFIAVYSLVLGAPFAIAILGRNRIESFFGEIWWVVPMLLLTVLATGGPFLYLFIQKRAEEQLLKEQRRYQSTLSQASAGMGRIKDLRRLLELIVYIVTRAVRLDHSSVYIFDSNKNKYLLGAHKQTGGHTPISDIEVDSALVKYLIKIKAPVVYEEVKQRVQDYNDQHLSLIENALKQLDAALVVPSLIEDRLLAILVMGKMKSGKLYGEDDLSVFFILANQAALAIENAQFYEDVKKTQEQLFQAEKMATIGTMADGLSHQINNRLHALGFIAGDALDTIKIKRHVQMNDEMKTVMADLERSLVRIQENVKQGGEVVQGLLRYTRKGETGYAPIEIDKLVTAALEMAQFKIKTHEMKIVREYDKEGPKIKGNFTQLQEVFFNMIDNAYDAMMQRKNEKKEPGYQPTLRILSVVDQDRIILKFMDNGIGVKEEDFQKIFTPFFTTKLSSKKGTGLGLYVIKKIIDDNHKGKVTFESVYMKGTTMILNLPMAY